MKIRLSKLADRDLREVYRYSVRQFGKAQAERYFFSIWECFELLAEHPRIGRERWDLSPPPRSYHHEKHIIFYDYSEDEIVIVRILHERMDVSNRKLRRS